MLYEPPSRGDHWSRPASSARIKPGTKNNFEEWQDAQRHRHATRLCGHAAVVTVPSSGTVGPYPARVMSETVFGRN